MYSEYNFLTSRHKITPDQLNAIKNNQSIDQNKKNRKFFIQPQTTLL